MEVVLTPTQESLIDAAVREGRLSGREDAMRQALALWEQHEMERQKLLADIAEADAEIERGEYIELSSREDLREFTNGVIERGIKRLAAKRH